MKFGLYLANDWCSVSKLDAYSKLIKPNSTKSRFKKVMPYQCDVKLNQVNLNLSKFLTLNRT
jgi:hypothetical protein